jgi:hypothetical protein
MSKRVHSTTLRGCGWPLATPKLKGKTRQPVGALCACAPGDSHGANAAANAMRCRSRRDQDVLWWVSWVMALTDGVKAQSLMRQVV